MTHWCSVLPKRAILIRSLFKVTLVRRLNFGKALSVLECRVSEEVIVALTPIQRQRIHALMLSSRLRVSTSEAAALANSRHDFKHLAVFKSRK